MALLSACARPRLTTPESEPPPAAAQLEPPPLGPIDQVEAILAEIEFARPGWISAEELREIESRGLDATLLEAALREAATRCRAHEIITRNPKLRLALFGLAEEIGTLELVPTTMALERCGWAGWPTTEAILGRAMTDEVGFCAPPSEREIAEARDSLTDFRVIDRRGKRWLARPPSPVELDDLAYFYAGIADAAEPIGTSGSFSSGEVEPDPAGVELRTQELAKLDEALRDGEFFAARDAAIRYLGSLGYPGPIDAALEVQWAWDGARYSYVMRDLARVAELLGELELASDLYLHANPAGGACGSSIDVRREDQLHGFIRTQERLGNCRSVVALRLLDWDDDYDPEGPPARAKIDHGPYRLARDGWDLERMFRGALLTRNRSGELDQLARVLASDADASARFEREGPENWDWRVRSIEGLADIGGRQAIDELVALLPYTNDWLRARTLAAIGSAARRRWAGPCETARERWLHTRSFDWHRPITPLGTTCSTQLDDEAARALAERLLPYTWRAGPVRWAAMEAIGELAVAEHGPMLRRWLARANKALKPCARTDVWTQACRDADDEVSAAERALEAWSDLHQREDDE